MGVPEEIAESIPQSLVPQQVRSRGVLIRFPDHGFSILRVKAPTGSPPPGRGGGGLFSFKNDYDFRRFKKFSWPSAKFLGVHIGGGNRLCHPMMAVAMVLNYLELFFENFEFFSINVIFHATCRGTNFHSKEGLQKIRWKPTKSWKHFGIFLKKSGTSEKFTIKQEFFSTSVKNV